MDIFDIFGHFYSNHPQPLMGLFFSYIKGGCTSPSQSKGLVVYVKSITSIVILFACLFSVLSMLQVCIFTIKCFYNGQLGVCVLQLSENVVYKQS